MQRRRIEVHGVNVTQYSLDGKMWSTDPADLAAFRERMSTVFSGYLPKREATDATRRSTFDGRANSARSRKRRTRTHGKWSCRSRYDDRRCG